MKWNERRKKNKSLRCFENNIDKSLEKCFRQKRKKKHKTLHVNLWSDASRARYMHERPKNKKKNYIEFSAHLQYQQTHCFSAGTVRCYWFSFFFFFFVASCRGIRDVDGDGGSSIISDNDVKQTNKRKWKITPNSWLCEKHIFFHEANTEATRSWLNDSIIQAPNF